MANSSASRKTAPKGAPRKKAARKTGHGREIGGLVLIAAAVFLGLCLYAPQIGGGVVGEWVKPFAFALFGWAAYLVPVGLAALGGIVIFSRGGGPRWHQWLLWGFFAWSLSAMISLFSIERVDASTLTLCVNGFYELGQTSLVGCGAVSALLLYPAYYLLSKWGAIVLFATVVLATVIVKTGLSLRAMGEDLRDAGEKVVSSVQSTVQERRISRKTKSQRLYMEDLNRVTSGKKSAPDLNLIDSTVFEGSEGPIPGEPNAPHSPGKYPAASHISIVPDFDEEPRKPPAQQPAKPTASAPPQVQVTVDNPSAQAMEKRAYRYPPLSLLEASKPAGGPGTRRDDYLYSAQKLEDTLQDFGIVAKVVQISRGPAITRYELQPAPGIKISRIVNLSNDIALSMAASAVRIEAPIPGKAAIGIEIPNTNITMVRLREVLESQAFQQAQADLTVCLGKDIAGKDIVTDLARMPHLLIAGATGSGKSSCINSLIVSLLYRSSPEQVRLIMVDPKMVELNVYNGIPHLLIPVVTDPKKAAGALNWAVNEMTRRYQQFAQCKVRDLYRFNEIAGEMGEEPMPNIVIIIDELADLMMVAPAEVEDSINRLAQMARAAGMHLVVATQRPSVDVITGVIKANIPSRIAFTVSSQTDSRTILDMGGAEKLLGKGDMLFNPSSAPKPLRVQGAFVTEEEVERVVDYIRDEQDQSYSHELLRKMDDFQTAAEEAKGGGDSGKSDLDPLLPQALDVLLEQGQASISMVQRRLRVGYSRAARIIDQMELLGIVGPADGSKSRPILKGKLESLQLIENGGEQETMDFDS